MDELNLGEVESLPLDEPTLRKADGRRFVCVRRADGVDVLDDKCPHEGYPLSQGTEQDGVLTCNWHNWKFDTATGACQFGGEDVRRFPCRLEGGEMLVDIRIDESKERRRLSESLARALHEGSLGSAMREALRLEKLDGDLSGALGVLAGDAARRARYGFDHGLALLADVAGWIEQDLVAAGPGFSAASGWVAEPMVLFAPRERPEPKPGTPADVIAALEEDRRADAEAVARHLVREGNRDALAREALLPWLARDLAGYGHGLIFLLKATELAASFEEHAEELFGALVHSHSWATLESALPGWRATHAAIREASEGGDADVDDAYEAEVLRSEKDAVRATLERLAAGVSANRLLEVAAAAAAERVWRFDPAWERRPDAPVTILGVSHALTFADAALGLAGEMSPRDRARFAVQAAGFVGKLAKADGEGTQAEPGDLADGLKRRSLEVALGGTDDPRFYEIMAEFALHDAFVRPIFAAHAIKLTEACRRLERQVPSRTNTFRAAAVTLVAPRRPERYWGRGAHIAGRFLEDGRPPPGLY